MQKFDWNLLRSFLAVAQTGSLSSAARKLGSSQPTIGRHITELERDLGVTLFLRGIQGHQLTQTGTNLLAHALTVEESVDRFSLQANGSQQTISGVVRISASVMMATMVLPSILAQLTIEEPDIEIELVATDAIDNLLKRDADIAVRMIRPAQEELIARKIADTPLSFCASQSYLDRRGTPTKPADLLNHVLIGQDRDDTYIKGFNSYGLKVNRHSFRFRTDDHLVIWNAVKSGIGIAIAQLPLIRREPSLKILLPQTSLPDLPMWLTMHKDLRNAPRIRRTADFLYQALSNFARSADAA